MRPAENRTFPMNSPFKTAMAEVTRLTRAGRLSDAMAAIRNALSGKEATAPQPGDSPAGQKTSVIDLQPPRAVDGAWTAPDQEAPRESDRQPETGQSWSGLPHGLAQAGMPEALRDFLGRIGEPGTLPGLDRGPNPAPAPLPEGARFEERVFANAAGRRAYKLYVP